MVWRQLIWFCDCYNAISFGSDLLIKSHTFSFSQLQYKNWHGLAPMGHQEPASHCNIPIPKNTPPSILCTFLYFLHQKKITLRVMSAVTSAAYLSESHKELCPALFFHALQLLSCAQCDTLHENHLCSILIFGVYSEKKGCIARK
jgi:hypothetical protein